MSCLHTTKTQCLTNNEWPNYLAFFSQHNRSSQQLTFAVVENQQTVQ